MSRRAAVVVIDACGAGALPDAAEYGDAGAHTLRHVAERVGGLDVPHLQALGLGSITAIPGVPPAADPALHGRLHPLGPGKESATGHWELMCAIPQRPLPSYPDGFPPDVVARLREVTGHEYCANKPANGMAVIEEWGRHHLATGELILYTSVDSVLQIAAHGDVLSEAALRETCARAREIMVGEHAVGRVIARPFTGEPGAFRRTTGRKDFAIAPPARTALDVLQERGVPTHGVGKIRDLFAGVGIDHSHPGSTNAIALESTTALLRELDHGLVFVNLVETDQNFGHRKDPDGWHAAVRAIDAAVGEWLGALGPDDLLVLTADHGCDPEMAHSDHTREYAPLLAAGTRRGRHDGALADVGQSVVRWLTGAPADLPGRSFLDA